MCGVYGYHRRSGPPQADLLAHLAGLAGTRGPHAHGHATAGQRHAAQKRYFAQHQLDVLVLGRRHAEGNHCGEDGLYTNREGVTRYSPIRHWPHEAVLALLKREGYSLPPIYGYPRGWQVGTGNWAQRLYTSSPDQGWDETWQIDPDIVREAATVLPQAQAYMTARGLS